MIQPSRGRPVFQLRSRHVYDKAMWNYEAGGNVTGRGRALGSTWAAEPQQSAHEAVQRQLSRAQMSEAALRAKPTEALLGLGYVAQGPPGVKDSTRPPPCFTMWRRWSCSSGSSFTSTKALLPSPALFRR